MVDEGARRRYIADDESERQLAPDPRPAQGRRMRFAQRHPAASTVVGIVSIVLLIVGVGLDLLQIAEPVSKIPPIAETLGTFRSPLHLPVWLNLALGLGAVGGRPNVPRRR